jgi:hypothetical protein
MKLDGWLFDGPLAASARRQDLVTTLRALSREHRRAKTDRLDTELLSRVLLGWLRGEKRHCCMVAIPAIEREDAKRPKSTLGAGR